MKAVTLLYHDAVTDGDYAASGFSGGDADVYKMDINEMRLHFEAVKGRISKTPSDVRDMNVENDEMPIFITFDDGGLSSSTLIAPLLNDLGWVGHFFITGSRVDTKGFVSASQIRELDAQGHVIGSHSWSHPQRMALCTTTQLEYEWRKSIEFLSEILEKPVTVASVPGGYFSKKVAKIASQSGLKILFTSEPVKKAYYIDNCLILGRYTLIEGMPPHFSSDLAADGISLRQIRQYLFWNSKKMLKNLAGDQYLAIRKYLLDRN